MWQPYTIIGPLRKTTLDFWRLIWQEKPNVIVMVTNLKECNKNKCEQYWPHATPGLQKFGPFHVSLIDEETFPDYVIRDITVVVCNINIKMCCKTGHEQQLLSHAKYGTFKIKIRNY